MKKICIWGCLGAAALMAGTLVAQASKPESRLTPGSKLKINGYINVSDRKTNDSIFAALSIASADRPVPGLSVTLNGTALEERPRTYNYSESAWGMDIAVGSNVRIEISTRPSLLPAPHGTTLLATISGTVAGVIRFSKPSLAPSPRPPAGETITFTWEYEGDISGPVDIMLYDGSSDALVSENHDHAGNSITFAAALLARGRPYKLHLIKSMGLLRPEGASVAPGSEVALRYIAELKIPPRLL